MVGDRACVCVCVCVFCRATITAVVGDRANVCVERVLLILLTVVGDRASVLKHYYWLPIL